MKAFGPKRVVLPWKFKQLCRGPHRGLVKPHGAPATSKRAASKRRALDTESTQVAKCQIEELFLLHNPSKTSEPLKHTGQNIHEHMQERSNTSTNHSQRLWLLEGALVVHRLLASGELWQVSHKKKDTCENPHSCAELQHLQLSKPLQKRSPLYQKCERLKRKHHLEPLVSLNLKFYGQVHFSSETVQHVWHPYVEPLNLSVEPKGFEPLCLYSEPLSGTLSNLEPFKCGMLLWNLGEPEPFCGTYVYPGT